MFQLTTISDLIQIKPEDFVKSSFDAIEDNINQKYANKVIPNTGLCIAMFDLLSHSQGHIGHGTGIVNVNVVFRIIVFRPWKGEIIEGIISNSSPQGITISVEFFDDIFVPGPVNLFEGSKFNGAEQVWVWTTEDGTELFFDNREIVWFRVEAETWHDQSPQKPSGDVDAEAAVERNPPYSIIASMQQGGLGPTLWW